MTSIASGNFLRSNSKTLLIVAATAATTIAAYIYLTRSSGKQQASDILNTGGFDNDTI
jgi:hypothetical protein